MAPAARRPGLLSHNLYGPTEYTVDTLRAALADSERPLIGRPVGNTSVYVLDARLQPVPVGVVGEALPGRQGPGRRLSGAQRAERRPFRRQPLRRRGRRAHVPRGDLVRWNREGRLEFVGRGD